MEITLVIMGPEPDTPLLAKNHGTPANSFEQ